jgi:hypothetical protein
MGDTGLEPVTSCSYRSPPPPASGSGRRGGVTTRDLRGRRPRGSPQAGAVDVPPLTMHTIRPVSARPASAAASASAPGPSASMSAHARRAAAPPRPCRLSGRARTGEQRSARAATFSGRSAAPPAPVHERQAVVIAPASPLPPRAEVDQGFAGVATRAPTRGPPRGELSEPVLPGEGRQRLRALLVHRRPPRAATRARGLSSPRRAAVHDGPPSSEL